MLKYGVSQKNGYTIVTFDSDFYDFSLIWGTPPKIIWMRTGNMTTDNIEQILRRQLKNIQDFISDEDLSCLEIIEDIHH